VHNGQGERAWRANSTRFDWPAAHDLQLDPSDISPELLDFGSHGICLVANQIKAKGHQRHRHSDMDVACTRLLSPD
jgi:hypothetical protein